MDSLVLKLYLASSAGVCTLAAILSLVALVKIYNLKKQLVESQDETRHDIHQTKKSVTTLEKVQVKLGTNQTHFEEKLEDLGQRMDRLEVRDSQFASYHHAAKLVEMGADSLEVAKTCGLSRAEADLVAMVNAHTTQKTAQDKLENETQDKPVDIPTDKTQDA